MLPLLVAGLTTLTDYVALHVLTCLVPAFFLAGAMNTFLSRDTIVRYLGSSGRKTVSFPLAAVSSIGLAVCSCTVIPIASGLYRRGSSLGPAFIFLWTAPALNVLTIVYSGAILGLGMTVMRIVAALSTAFIVGLVMVYVFRREERERAEKARSKPSTAGGGGPISWRRSLLLLLLLVATLLLPNYLGIGRPYLEKVLIFSVPFAVTLIYAYKAFKTEEIKEWLHETWWFVRMIFPLLLAGVFVVGVVGAIIPELWVQQVLGGNGILPTFLANLLGSVIYFSSLTESPFVKMLMNLGMGKSPALAMLLTGPGLSLPSMLAIMRIFTVKKGAVYIITTIILSTLAAFALGNLFW
ncbi:MAG: permease [Candidatus Verstraetearchaeota archaeon]|nr:permease [Candidatus Verstraetearchaeota archaeon]